MKKIMNGVIFLLFAYPFGIFFVGIPFLLFWLIGIATVNGWKNLPKWQGKLIVASNHPSLLEPIILIGLFFLQFLFRPFKYAPWNMAEVKNFGGPLFYLLRPRIIFVKRGDRPSEVSAFRRAMEILKAGGVILLFPEGGRTSSGTSFIYSRGGKRMREFKQGFACLAEKTGATILPVWVEGTDEVLPNGSKISYRHLKPWKRVKIHIGRPLQFNEGESREEITARVQTAVLELADQGG